MAGQVCKIIINNLIRGLILSLEEILFNESLCEKFGMCDSDRLSYIQKMANIDLAVYSGDRDKLPEGGLCGIVREMQEKYGMITDEVWVLYNRIMTHEDMDSTL